MNQPTYLKNLQSLNKMFFVKKFDEEVYCQEWFGSNYLGNGYVKCDFCKDVPVKIDTYFAKNVCEKCKKELI
jgi:hypothetical protein